MRQSLAKLGLLAVSALLCLAIAELLVRQIVDPVNFLRPSLVRDDVLRWRVEPYSAGHDGWGYRNPEVPESVDIVTIGDSQTYGHGAPASGSWPSWLSQLTGRSVYNLALGGYGPVDYRALVQSRALELSPGVIVVGLYFGNDLMDAWRSAYTLDHWAFLRDPDWEEGDTTPPPPGAFEQVAGGGGAGSAIRAVKMFLGRHSVLYRMAGLAFSDLIYGYATRQTGAEDPDIELVHDERGEFVTGLAAARRLREVDLGDPRIREGLRITLDSLDAIRGTCEERGIRLVVLLIPTKISVFADYDRQSRKAASQSVIERLVANERAARDEVERWLDGHQIPYATALGALRSRLGEARIYPLSGDGHPTSLGYRVLAEQVSERLRSSGSLASSGIDESTADR